MQAKAFSIFNDTIRVLDQRISMILSRGCYRHEKECAKSAWIPTFVAMTSAAVERFCVVNLQS
jgi:hypothetical protein